MGGGSGECCRATSCSIVDNKASASSARPTDSSQRGDSGSFLRKYQTTSAPSPPSTNMARQPNLGMISTPEQRGDRQAGDDEDGHEAQPFAARLRRYEFR